MTASKLQRVSSAMRRTVFLFGACGLLVSTMAAQCTNPTQVPNQTISSGSQTFSDNNALRAAAVVINGSASVTFAAGNCIELAPGFRATAGSAPTTFHAIVESAPTADSAAPTSGSGLSQSFTFRASSASGSSNLSEMLVLFNTAVSGANACYVRYNRASNQLYLADDSAATWLGGIAPQSAASLSNSHCSINGNGSSASETGAQLTLTVAVTFQAASAGTQNEYLYVADNEGLHSGWHQMGTWTVPAPPVPDFVLTGSQQGATVLPGRDREVTYAIVIELLNGLNGPLAFGAPLFPGCQSFTASATVEDGPFRRTTLRTTCTEASAITYFIELNVMVGTKWHTLVLTLQVTASEQYYLTTGVSPPGGGNINIAPAGGLYDARTSVEVTATANPGYVFTGFTGALTGSSPGYVYMNASKNVTANFAQTAVTQRITSAPTGRSLTVDGTGCTAPCDRQWQAGTNHRLPQPTSQE